jgi:HSP20 family protein
MPSVAIQKHREAGRFPENLWQQMNSLTDEIRNRAFSLFERRGRTLGWDLDDWLQAEREVLWSPASELIEGKEDFRARIALPGFDPKDLEVTASPNALVVRAESTHKHEGKEGDVRICEFSGKKMFRRLDLPSEIDVERATASLDKGILEITAPKAVSKQLKVAA